MGKDNISWIDTNGNEFNLTNSESYEILNGVKGFHMPPIEITEEEVPFQPGSRPRNTKVKARTVDIPLKISGTNEIEFLQAMRNLLRIFNPLKGDGKFRVTSIDDSVRELKCRYLLGFEMEEDANTRGLTWQKAVGVFKAFDPFWYDTATITQTFKLNENPALFFPILPLRLASSTVFADITITNDGDVETWPEWIIRGPGENIQLRNLTTGEVIYLDDPDAKLQAGETITINTSPIPPNEKTVLKSDGTNLFYTLSDDSSLWALQDGTNSIQIQMANATADSIIQISYRNRYWGP